MPPSDTNVGWVVVVVTVVCAGEVCDRPEGVPVPEPALRVRDAELGDAVLREQLEAHVAHALEAARAAKKREEKERVSFLFPHQFPDQCLCLSQLRLTDTCTWMLPRLLDTSATLVGIFFSDVAPKMAHVPMGLFLNLRV